MIRNITQIDVEYVFLSIVVVLCLIVLRIYSCFPKVGSGSKKTKVSGLPGHTVKTMVYFGSGGHTMEMIRLLSDVDAQKYRPCIFAIGHTDITSMDAIRLSDIGITQTAKFLRVYRNREVKQSWITTVFTSLWSLLQALGTMYRLRPALLLCNGPGTCVSLAYAAFFWNVLGVSKTTIVFVESFCRTKDLSLTGKLLLPIVDKAIVQWPSLLPKSSKLLYIGAIC